MDTIDCLVLRWSPAQRENAAAIVNDIAEDIDNGESRKQLRQALAIYADMLSDALQSRSDRRTTVVLECLEKVTSLIDAHNDKPIDDGGKS